MPFNPGDIVLVSFPFTDLSGTKQRPALVLHSSIRNDVLVMAITSQIPPVLANDEFEIPQADLAVSGLPKRSIVRLTKLVTLHDQLVRKKLGTLPSATHSLIVQRIRSLL